MTVTRNGNRAIHHRTDKRPDKAWDHLTIMRHDLQTERQAVDIRTVVRHDAQRQDDETKVTEATQRSLQHGAEQTTDMRVFVPVQVSGRGGAGGGGRDGETEPLRKGQGDDQPGVGPCEGFHTGDMRGLVDGVIRGVRSPAGREAENRRGETEDGARFGAAGRHGDVDEVTRMCEFS